VFGADPEAEIRADASIHLHKFNFERDAALFIRLDQQGFRTASFLDDRILSKDTQGAWRPIASAINAARAAEQQLPLHFIFHAGHVGSTLISRLLDEVPGTQPLREPQSLRQLAEVADGLSANGTNRAAFDMLLDAQVRLWRRGFPDTQHVILKATSATARLAEVLLGTAQGSRAAFLNLRPEAYLATCLAGENTPTDLRGMGGERVRRLANYLNAPPLGLEQLSLGELTAMTWVVEALTHEQARSAFAQQSLMLDFDDFLAAPGARAGDIARHFGLAWSDDIKQRVVRSPALSRYSKAQEYEYSPALRRAVLDQARAQHGEEIRKGLRWIDEMAKAHPPIASMLARK
jgi:hypothetical protein